MPTLVLASLAALFGAVAIYYATRSFALTAASDQPRLIAPLASLIMQVVLSLVVIGAGLYMILSGRYDASNQHWAYGIIGTVVGFWLKGAR
jgi:hypothetical protein